MARKGEDILLAQSTHADRSAAERLAALEAERKARDKAEDQHAAGFDVEADYDAWLILERIRKTTKSLREPSMDSRPRVAVNKRPAGVSEPF